MARGRRDGTSRQDHAATLLRDAMAPDLLPDMCRMRLGGRSMAVDSHPQSCLSRLSRDELIDRGIGLS